MEVYGLIGNPVGHSLSPPMHEAAYEALNIDAKYVTFEPEPKDVEHALSGADVLGIRGLNVTIPFKQAVLEYVCLSDLATRIGAVNTIDFATTPPTGYNTDASGVVEAFKYHDISIGGKDVLIIGAGGAGRAIAFGMADAGADIFIINRTIERAHEIAQEITNASSHDLDSISKIAPKVDIIINATSVGMSEEKSPVKASSITADHLVMDIVYHPIETTLLKIAKQKGARTIDGGWMLLFQGAKAFEQWTGEKAPIDVMNQALRERL